MFTLPALLHEDLWTSTFLWRRPEIFTLEVRAVFSYSCLLENMPQANNRPQALYGMYIYDSITLCVREMLYAAYVNMSVKRLRLIALLRLAFFGKSSEAKACSAPYHLWVVRSLSASCPARRIGALPYYTGKTKKLGAGPIAVASGQAGTGKMRGQTTAARTCDLWLLSQGLKHLVTNAFLRTPVVQTE